MSAEIQGAGGLLAALVFVVIGLCLAYLALDFVVRLIHAIWRDADQRHDDSEPSS